MLTSVSSIWTISSALCIARAPQAMQQPTETLSGFLLLAGTPCDVSNPETPCADCLTLAFEANGTLYYLTSDNSSMETQLNEIEAQVYSPKRASVTGILYQQSSYNYINVKSISLNNDPLPSLCDTWNMLTEPFSCVGPYCYLQTTVFHLTTDTIINTEQYIKLIMGSNTYKGALREGTNRDIYFVPEGSTHEYLLYAFNAQVGDTLTNLWIGGVYDECPNGYNGIIQTISDGTPRKFTIAIDIDIENDPHYSVPRKTEWIEGVGFLDNPTGPLFFLGAAVDYGVETLLCAYKNGEQVYSSSKAERYGCEFNGIPSAKPYSLCDTWNVLGISTAMWPDEIFSTQTQRLTKDTVIAYPSYYNFTRYVRLEENGRYKGAMREGGNRDIYFIPAGSTHEYLLYYFNAKVGQKLRNLWFGGLAEWYPNGLNATVTEISDSNPKVYTLEAEVVFQESNDTVPVPVYWIEGVGMETGPVGKNCFYCVDDYRQVVLCAYKNGVQVYASELSEQYGCEYNYDPFGSGLSNQSPDTQCTKLLRDGLLLILRGNKTYTIQGQEVK